MCAPLTDNDRRRRAEIRHRVVPELLREPHCVHWRMGRNGPEPRISDEALAEACPVELPSD